MVIGQGQFEALLVAGKPVEHADLSAIDWSDLAEGGLVARLCVLADALMGDAELAGARFEDCTFSRCRFAGTNLTDAVFLRCAFFDSETRTGCSFSRADLNGASFENCNLATCSFEFAELFDVTIRNCKAAGADFGNARFGKPIGGKAGVSRATFIGSMLDLANFEKAGLADCILTECSLRQTDFTQAVLSSADLRGSDLSEANLDGVILDNADLREAILFGIDVTRLTSFEGIKVSSDQLSDIVRAIGIKVFP
ncbi:pentapeptide repeat-containing protein [Pelagibacterium limicola]|uniref:pentapeptide repeat-containing protein n=1 Tax=Pelagibacterium limicola TaxID=2791022 RepID=UPI0018AFD69D